MDIAPQPSTYLHDHGAAIDWMDFHMREMLSKRADSRAGESRLRSSNGRGAIVIVLALFDPHDDAQLIWSRVANHLSRTTSIAGGYFAHTTDAGIFASATGLAPQSENPADPRPVIIEVPTAPCVLLFNIYDEKYEMLNSLVLAGLDAIALEVRGFLLSLLSTYIPLTIRVCPVCAGASQIARDRELPAQAELFVA